MRSPRGHFLLILTMASLLVLAPRTSLGDATAKPDVTAVSKRDLKRARVEIERGRWKEVADTYERALTSPIAADPAVYAEALYVSMMVHLEAAREPADLGEVVRREARLAGPG